jgi:replication-associated recombination protein RarA
MGEFRFAERATVGGYLCGEVASALQKDIRRGNEREAVFWATELALSGFSNYCWKRLRIIASEDVGLGSPMMPVLVRTLYENFVEQKKADGGDERNAMLFLVHAVLALSRAEKSRMVDTAYVVAMGGSSGRPHPEIPDYALDMHTGAGRRMKRGVEHFYREGAVVAPAAPIDDPYLEEAIAIDEELAAKRRRRRKEE